MVERPEVCSTSVNATAALGSAEVDSGAVGIGAAGAGVADDVTAGAGEFGAGGLAGWNVLLVALRIVGAGPAGNRVSADVGCTSFAKAALARAAVVGSTGGVATACDAGVAAAKLAVANAPADVASVIGGTVTDVALVCPTVSAALSAVLSVFLLVFPAWLVSVPGAGEDVPRPVIGGVGDATVDGITEVAKADSNTALEAGFSAAASAAGAADAGGAVVVLTGSVACATDGCGSGGGVVELDPSMGGGPTVGLSVCTSDWDASDWDAEGLAVVPGVLRGAGAAAGLGAPSLAKRLTVAA